MAYTPTEWRNGETALSAGNMTHIETGIKDAHDALENMFTKDEIFNAIYPVGSIYMSASSANPGTLFGGTWVEWGQGRVPVGVGTSDRAFAANETGGSSNAVVVQHNHPATFQGAAVGGHTHTGPSHSHTMAHTHTPSKAANAFVTVDKRYPIARRTVLDIYSPKDTQRVVYDNVYYGDSNIERNNNTSGSSAGFTGNAGTGATGSAGSHTPAGSVTVSNSGSAGTNKNLQPYITCYMWKRTA